MTLDQLEAPLREAHEAHKPITFQDFVRGIRRDKSHELHLIATEFNRRVYEMQNKNAEREPGAFI